METAQQLPGRAPRARITIPAFSDHLTGVVRNVVSDARREINAVSVECCVDTTR